MSENKKLLTQDSLFGIKEYMHFDETGDNFVIETVQDAEPIVEWAKMANKERMGTRWGDGLTHVAVMPMTVYLQAVREKWDQERLKRWVNDPDNAYLRTKQGTI